MSISFPDFVVWLYLSEVGLRFALQFIRDHEQSPAVAPETCSCIRCYRHTCYHRHIYNSTVCEGIVKDAVSVTFGLWFFWWPICFLRFVPGIDNALLWVSLAMGILLDMLFISLATYFVLRAIVSRQKRVRAATPPEPPNFHSRNA